MVRGQFPGARNVGGGSINVNLNGSESTTVMSQSERDLSTASMVAGICTLLQRRMRKKRACVLVAALATSRKKRRFKVHSQIPRKVMDWSYRLAQLNDRQFKQRYRLDKEGFDILARDIKDDTVEYERKRGVRTMRKIPIEVKLSATLRFLAGGSFVDIIDLHGISQTAFYAFYPCVCLAICNHAKYTINFPIDDDEALDEIARGFAEVRKPFNPVCRSHTPLPVY